MNERKKRRADDPGRPVKRLAVLGAGFMGAGVAGVSLGKCPVTMRDISGEALAKGGKVVRKSLEAQTRSGAIRRSERDRRWSRLQLTTKVEDLAGADLIVEAVFEDLALKQKVLAEVEEAISPEAVFASNTSALPISAIAAEAKHPERVLGMHYFSPVHMMPLLELVVADKTDPGAVATARGFAAAQGKSVIEVKDGPGFYTTRILAGYLNEAMIVLEQGAPMEDIDGAMRDYGYPVGPVVLADEVGLDVAAHVTRDLLEAFERWEINGGESFVKMVDAGFQGRKNGRGFYAYPPKGKKGRKKPNPEAYEFFGGAERKPIPKAEIQDRLAMMMINEAALCLEEGVINSAGDGDIGAMLGLGFPPFRGGPFHTIDTIGIGAVVDQLDELSQRHGSRFAPPQILRDMAKKGSRFYD